jgi:dipeptidyl aminopeptidase/acylaminoacyl peptidase
MQGPGTLMAQRLELDPPRLKGNPATVAEGIGIVANTGYAEFSVSNSSTLFYVPGTGGGKIRLGWRDRAGKRLDTMGPAADKTRGEFSLSPDGSRVAYTVAANPGQNDVWVLDLALGVSRRITFSNATEPRWSPGGKHLYYTSPAGILRKAADGSADEELLMKGLGNEFLTSVSPDGKNLLYGFTDIMRLPLTGARKPEPYLQTKHQEGFASFSPDGRWVAYHSNESGQFEIYVQGFPERRGKWLVSTESGFMPKWRGDGKELYWHGPQSTLMAASVELQASGVRVVGHPEALFRVAGPFQPRSDGLRFLVSEPEGAERARTMMVQLNWVGRLGK